MKKADQAVPSKQLNIVRRERLEKIISTQFIVEELPRSSNVKGLILFFEDELAKFKLKPNDIVEIIGERKTYARIGIKKRDLLFERQIDTNLEYVPRVQMDYTLRKNAEVKVGDMIKIRKMTSRLRSANYVVLLAESSEYKNTRQEFINLKKELKGRIIKKGDELWMPSLMNEHAKKLENIYTPPSNPLDLYFTVFFCEPKGRDAPVEITEHTVIKIRQTNISYSQILTEEVYMSDVGGLKNAKDALMEIAGIAVNEYDFIERSGLDFTNCVLLSGPSGCGKTLLSKAIVNEFPVSYFYINGPEIAGEKPSEAPEDLRKTFEDAQKSAPSIVVIDQVEALATNREDLRFDSIMRNIVTQFLHLLETIAKSNNVFVIATTNKPESIDTAFMTQSRFGKEIKIGPPKKNERMEILEIMSNQIDIINLDSFDIDVIAENTYGFSGGDMNLLFQVAFIEKLKKLGIYNRFVKSKFSYNILRDKTALTTEDFMDVLTKKLVKPSILRTYSIENPKISFNRVGGLKDAKRILRENIQYPQSYPQIYKHYKISGFKGLLLYGPPGCGKTLLVKALASESNMNFISIKGAEVLNHWLGESEAAVREIFSKAKESAPCIVFFDELDAVATRRGVEGNVHSDRVTAQILTELDGIEEIRDVICIGATNRLDIIDPAIMRPGRLYPMIEIGLPDDDSRSEIFSIYLKDKPIANDVHIPDLVAKTDGFNGAEIEELCNQAALAAARQFLKEYRDKEYAQITPISMKDFNDAIKELKDKLRPTLGNNLYT